MTLFVYVKAIYLIFVYFQLGYQNASLNTIKTMCSLN